MEDGGHLSSNISTGTSAQVGLGANSVNGNTGSKPLLDVADHAVHLGVTGGIQAL
jgi:hypothetical protein